MSTFSILNETLFRCFLRWFIDNRHNGHEAGDAVTMPLHLGSTLATVFVALFSSSLGVFASFRSRPRMPVMNGSWRISRTEGNRRRRRKGEEERGKKISRPMLELFEDEDSWCSGVWKKKRQHGGGWNGRGEVCRRRRAFRMIDRTSYILTMADHR